MVEIIIYVKSGERSPEEYINDIFAKLTKITVAKVACSNQDQASLHFGELPFLFYGSQFVPRWQILSFWVATSTVDDFLTPGDSAKTRTVADLLQTRLSVI